MRLCCARLSCVVVLFEGFVSWQRVIVACVFPQQLKNIFRKMQNRETKINRSPIRIQLAQRRLDVRRFDPAPQSAWNSVTCPTSVVCTLKHKHKTP